MDYIILNKLNQIEIGFHHLHHLSSNSCFSVWNERWINIITSLKGSLGVNCRDYGEGEDWENYLICRKFLHPHFFFCFSSSKWFLRRSNENLCWVQKHTLFLLTPSKRGWSSLVWIIAFRMNTLSSWSLSIARLILL